jgi:hypothetical protein
MYLKYTKMLHKYLFFRLSYISFLFRQNNLLAQAYAITIKFKSFVLGFTRKISRPGFDMVNVMLMPDDTTVLSRHL